jgi:hypothetical protein
MDYSSFYKVEKSKIIMEERGMNLKSKRAQLTLFIILGLIIVSAIILFFMYVYPSLASQRAPQLAIENCVKGAISGEVSSLALTAGALNPTFNSMYQDENYSFICYTDEYYQPCVVQTPFLTSQFENSLKTRISQKVLDCYSNSLESLRAQGYEVVSGTPTTNIVIEPEQILVTINSPTTVSSGESSQDIGNKFEVKIASKLYYVLAIANSLLQFETAYGDTDTSSLILYYPDFSIDKVRRDNGVRLYTVSDKGNIKFKFAVRSYAWPPGYAI